MASSISVEQASCALQVLQTQGLITRFTLGEGGHGRWTHEVSVFVDRPHSHHDDLRIRSRIEEALQGFPAIIRVLMRDTPHLI
jgi:hypothetical protein